MKGRILEFRNTQSKIFITNKRNCTIKWAILYQWFCETENDLLEK